MGSCCGCQSDENRNGGREDTHRDRDKSRRSTKEREMEQERRRAAEDRRSVSSVSSRSTEVEKKSEKEAVIYVALFDYVPNCPAELSLKKGDRVEFLTNEPSNFMFVRQAKLHGVRGYVPAEFLALEGSGMDEDFFYGEIHRADAVKILSNGKYPAGTFLIRLSKGKTDPYDDDREADDFSSLPFVVSVKDGASPPIVHHYRIRMTSSERYFLKRKSTFPSIRDMISYYQSDEGAGEIACRLADFVPRPVPRNRSLPEEMRDRWREIPREQLQLTQTLGEGRFGEVHKAIWHQPEGRTITVVAKQLKQLSLPDRKLLLDEAGTMKDLRHENIVRLYGVVSSSDPYYIVTEFVKDGSLHDYLKNRKKYLKPPLPTRALIDICTQIARGMAFMARKRLVHRDLAARNVLIDVKTESPFSCIVKVADFGLARLLNKEYIYKMKRDTYIATRWLAPEGFETVFSPETDIWSFGITTLEVFKGGDDPWDDLDEREVRKRILRGQIPDKPPAMPQSSYDITKRCCDQDPTRRPKFAQLVLDFEALRS